MLSQNPKEKTFRGLRLIVVVGFASIGLLISLDEILDLAHFVFGAPATSVNWAETGIELGLILLIGWFCVHLLSMSESRRRQVEGALAAERERLDVTLRSIGDGVIATDVEGRITVMNQTAESLTGWTQGEALGKPLSEVFHIINEKTRKRCDNPVEKVFESGGIVGLANDAVLVSRDGTERIIADSGAPIRDEKGNVIGVILVFRDMTERVQAQKVLQKAHQELAARVQELARANEEMQSFIYSISHDLRMPLVAVQGFTNLLKEEYGDDLKGEAEHYLSAIVQSTGKMSDLIEDLLQLSRVGRMDTEPEEVALESLVEAITTELKVETPKRKLNFRIKEPLPETYCNRKRLYQVFSNLLGNAVKFTRNMPEAKIEVGVKKKGDKKEFYVQDNGPGIDPQYHEEVFKAFRRLHGSGYEGSGMGLTFAKKIVESWGGNLRLESKPGKGATFYFTVPEAQKSSRAKSERVSSDSSGVTDQVHKPKEKT